LCLLENFRYLLHEILQLYSTPAPGFLGEIVQFLQSDAGAGAAALSTFTP
jgi:hypothetical protein